MKHVIKIWATVTVKDKNGKVLRQAKSRTNNLILNNFGIWLAGLIRTPVTAAGTVVLTDIVPSAQTVTLFSGAPGSAFNVVNAATGTQVQVGSGQTPAQRGDTNIQTPFATAPENTRFATGPGSYTGGVITFSGSITAGGNGTIYEVGFFAAWSAATVLKYFMLFHDLLATGVSFVATNIIIVSYSVQL